MNEKLSRPTLLGRITIVYAAYTALMLEIERRLRQTGGPGIIPFELAGTADRASEMMGRWGIRGQKLARISLRFDFGYMLTYGAHTALLVNRARQRQGHGPAVLALVLGAIGGDAVEGLSLLKVLDGNQVDLHARRARTAASVKFALLAVCLIYVVICRAAPQRGSDATGSAEDLVVS